MTLETPKHEHGGGSHACGNPHHPDCDDDPSVTRRSNGSPPRGISCGDGPVRRTGLNQAERSHPHAIILDLRMPLVDGLQFLRTLRSKEDLTKMPVAIVTGDYFLDDAVSRELRGLGAEVRFKPLWLEDLLALARNLLKA